MEYEVVIIGSGPAGIQAAIHSSRMKARTAVVGNPRKSAIYGQKMENYFGIDLVNGGDLIEIGISQARKFGAEIFEEDVVQIEKNDNGFTVVTDYGNRFECRALILAPGVSRTKLGVEGEKEYLGKGVSYCASCDCNFFRNRRVAVVGDESEAASAAILLKDYASHVYWISDKMDVAPPLLKKVKEAGVDIMENSRIRRIRGDQLVRAIELEDGSVLEVDGVFIELGAKSSMELVLDIDLIPDADGRIRVDRNCATEIEGVFACGDVTGQPWQLAKAVGEGCVAGTNAAKYARDKR